jgi:predicted O-linked N-acetylglucosamine transferase (SPINDLY family)
MTGNQDIAHVSDQEIAGAALRLGDTFRSERDYVSAEECYRRALTAGSPSRYALVALGVVLGCQERVEEAIACYRDALMLEPDALDARMNLADALFHIGQYNEARALYSGVMASHPDHGSAAAAILVCDMLTCSWSTMDDHAVARMHLQKLSPLHTLMLSASPPEQLFFAQKHARENGMNRAEGISGPAMAPAGGAIRVGYLSADFHEHATAALISELFELHDRSQFEIIGISCGRDDGSAARQRLIAAFDEFIDISDMDDAVAALWIETMRIDILVDLKGYTSGTRSSLLSLRPAPITVSYLGFPGTMGCDAVDYILADSIVLPFADQQYYSEKIVHLPGCYQVNDSKMEISSSTMSRVGQGLPEQGIVFCCLNAHHKITAPVFETWMRLLKAVQGSVLWLYVSNPEAQQNLRLTAEALGVEPSRIIFAPPLSHAEHVARYRLADIFLDTTPYNAHTTASDALRMGVPLVTLRGTTFASRVAASLLAAIGVPELVGETLVEYEAIALRLATNPTALMAMREKIKHGVIHGSLFDTPRFARHIEAAYKEMYRLALAGEVPRHFAVESSI